MPERWNTGYDSRSRGDSWSTNQWQGRDNSARDSWLSPRALDELVESTSYDGPPGYEGHGDAKAAEEPNEHTYYKKWK